MPGITEVSGHYRANGFNNIGVQHGLVVHVCTTPSLPNSTGSLPACPRWDVALPALRSVQFSAARAVHGASMRMLGIPFYYTVGYTLDEPVVHGTTQ